MDAKLEFLKVIKNPYLDKLGENLEQIVPDRKKIIWIKSDLQVKLENEGWTFLSNVEGTNLVIDKTKSSENEQYDVEWRYCSDGTSPFAKEILGKKNIEHWLRDLLTWQPVLIIRNRPRTYYLIEKKDDTKIRESWMGKGIYDDIIVTDSFTSDCKPLLDCRAVYGKFKNNKN